MQAIEQTASGVTRAKINRRGEEASEYVPLPALAATILNRHLVLLGDPGSGKSTFSNYLAFCLSTSDLDQLPDWPADEANVLPVLVILRDFARWLQSQDDKPQTSARLLTDYIRHDLSERNASFAFQVVEQAFESGNAFLLLDGLDEVPTDALRTLVRDSVLAFTVRYPSPRLLATCRVLSYQDPAWQLPVVGFPAFELAPLDDKKIETFVNSWYEEVSQTWKVPATRTTVLARALREAVRRSDLQPLATNPMLLTVMALVHMEEGELPDARALLYEKAVDILLWRWEQEKAKEQAELSQIQYLFRQAGRNRGDLRSTLEELSFHAHSAAPGEGVEAGSRALTN